MSSWTIGSTIHRVLVATTCSASDRLERVSGVDPTRRLVNDLLEMQ